MNKKIAISFSYDGYHRKSNGPIDSMKHLQMLIAAIDNANPNGEYAVIVSAIGFDIWSIPSEDERMLAWEVYRKADVVTVKNSPEDHQHGASRSIRMATEAAAAIKTEYLIHIAEDILLRPGAVDYFVKHLQQCDYVGSWWGNTDHQSVNTQIFGCRVSSFADLYTRRFVVDPTSPVPHVEGQVWGGICRYGLSICADESSWGFKDIAWDDLFFHSHDPEEFFDECRRIGVPITENLGCTAPELLDRFWNSLHCGCDVSEHCMTLLGMSRQVKTVTEFGTRTGFSTTAFLASASTKVICYDIVLHPDAAKINEIVGDRMEFHLQSTLEADIEETDLLFIDTYHTYDQLKQELAMHSSKARRWIVFHDTTSFGEVGEDGKSPGLWKAIEEFLESHHEWKLKSRVAFCNGLTILERVNDPTRK